MTEQKTTTSNPDVLAVTTTHLRALAATHTCAAEAIDVAAGLIGDPERSITVSHGVVAASTARVVDELLHARRRCAAAAAHAERVVSDSVTVAAQRYEETDESAGDDLDRQIGPP